MSKSTTELSESILPSIDREAELELTKLLNDVFISELMNNLKILESNEKDILSKVKKIAILEETVDDIGKAMNNSLREIKRIMGEDVSRVLSEGSIRHVKTRELIIEDVHKEIAEITESLEETIQSSDRLTEASILVAKQEVLDFMNDLNNLIRKGKEKESDYLNAILKKLQELKEHQSSLLNVLRKDIAEHHIEQITKHSEKWNKKIIEFIEHFTHLWKDDNERVEERIKKTETLSQQNQKENAAAFTELKKMNDLLKKKLVQQNITTRRVLYGIGTLVIVQLVFQIV